MERYVLQTPTFLRTPRFQTSLDVDPISVVDYKFKRLTLLSISLCTMVLLRAVQRLNSRVTKPGSIALGSADIIH